MGSSGCAPDQVYLIPVFFSIRFRRCIRVSLYTPHSCGYQCNAIQCEVRGRAAHLIKAKEYWEFRKKNPKFALIQFSESPSVTGS